MKQLFAYYGGKQRMAQHIIPVVNSIPHKVYVESFCGGATIFFAKATPSIGSEYREILNDFNSEIVNFFRVCQDKNQFEELMHILKYTPYSREEYDKAKKCDDESSVRRAWAWYVNCEMSYAKKLNGGFGYGIISQNQSDSFARKIDSHLEKFDAIINRLRHTYIENLDAVVCMKKYDSPNTLFYCDPPYIDTVQGHYAGYSREDYKRLLDFFTGCKGSFILSGYDNDMVPKDWPCDHFNASSGAASGKNGAKTSARIECLWVVRKGMGHQGEQMTIS